MATAGGGSSVYTIGNGFLGYTALSTFIAGTAGGGGGNANGTGTSSSISMITSGGSGGAGTNTVNRNGSTISGGSFIPNITGGNGSTLAQANSGFSTFAGELNSLRNPLFFTGGGGGFSNNTGTGGNGGNGALGSGGGGAGAGVTGGRGGDGGHGLVMITCW